MTDTKKVAVLGAGPAGLACAYSLLKQGYHVEIFEETAYVGGMCRSFKLFDQIVDVGPHRFFSKIDRVNEFWKNCHEKDDLLMVKRLSRIYYNGKFFYYPLRGWDALKKLGFFSSLLCVLSYAKARLSPFKGNDFETWVSNAFGHRLFEIFFKTYSEKLWGISCRELDKAFAAQRIKGFNLMEAAKTAFLGNKDQHQTLLSHFLYPKYGCGQGYEALAEKFEEQGGIIHKNCKVVKLNVNANKVTGIDYVINRQEKIPHTHTHRFTA